MIVEVDTNSREVLEESVVNDASVVEEDLNVGLE
jgi:hypothetical protein